MPTHETFRVGDVMSFDAGSGFHITNEHGRPLFSIVYPTSDKAQSARAQIEAALVEAVTVISYG